MMNRRCEIRAMRGMRKNSRSSFPVAFLVRNLMWGHALSWRRRTSLMFLSGQTLRMWLSASSVFSHIDLSWLRSHAPRNPQGGPHFWNKTLSPYRQKAVFWSSSCAVNFNDAIPSTFSSSKCRTGGPRFRHQCLCKTEKPRPSSHSAANVL